MGPSGARPSALGAGRSKVDPAESYFTINSRVGAEVVSVDGLKITNFELEMMTPATAPPEELTLKVPSEFTEYAADGKEASASCSAVELMSTAPEIFPLPSKAIGSTSVCAL